MREQRCYLFYGLRFLLLSIYSLDRVTRGLVGSTVARKMHIGPVALGYLFSSHLWLYPTTLLPAGTLTDRVSTRRMCAIAAGCWSEFQILGDIAGSVGRLLVTRLGLGIFESGVNPCAHKAIREWTPRGERGVATAIW